MRHTSHLVGLAAPCLAALSFAAPVAGAQRAIAGTVTDTSMVPIPFAIVTISGANRVTTTNASGQFKLLIARDADLIILIRRLGYHPEERRVRVHGDSATAVAFRLVPLPANLEAVSSIAVRTQRLERSGFYDRLADAGKGLLTGSFVGPEEIESRHPTSILSMFNARTGISITGKKLMGQGGACPMMVYVNGILVDGPNAAAGSSRISADQYALRTRGSVESERPFTSPVEEAAPANSVAAIEIYPRAVSAPPEFQRLAGDCGIVLIWTK